MTQGPAPTVSIAPVRTTPGIDEIRSLFVEYAHSLDFELSFQGFEAELAALPGLYAAPRGCLLLARAGRQIAGGVGVRPLSADEAEMKRLFVRPPFRGLSIGRQLAEKAVEFAREAGYSLLRLDTVPDRMTAADGMYRKMGFRETGAYYENPIPGAAYFALRLAE